MGLGCYIQSGKEKKRVGLYNAGFTLLEVLIAIAVIGLLAAILLPVVRRVQETGSRTACQNNLRQLGMALRQYTFDHDNRLPSATDGMAGIGERGGWVFYNSFPAEAEHAFEVAKGSLYTYIKTPAVYVCPTDDSGETTGNSYSVNQCLYYDEGASPSNRGRRLTSIKDPSAWMLMGEETAELEQTDLGSSDDGYMNLMGNNAFSTRHGGGSSLLFCDNHVRWYRTEQIVERGFQIGGRASAPPGTACPP